MTDRSLADVVADLDAVIADARADGRSLGYFPAMYRSVTAEVHRAISEGGFFEDDRVVERFAVDFAGLYLDAYAAFRSGRAVSACWAVAFDAATDGRRRMILQHLLLGMNAHINLDLGIAAARVMGPRLPALYGDFIKVNEILFRLMESLRVVLGALSPRLRLIDRWGWRADDWVMRMSIRSARDLAWRLADDLCECEDDVEVISDRDGDAVWLGRLIARRFSPVHLVGRFVAAREPTEPGPVIDALITGRVDLEEVRRVADQEMRRDLLPPLRLRDAVSSRRLPPFRQIGRAR